MTTRLTADVAVHEYLRILEREMNLFGSALPQNKDRPAHHLTVKEVEEYDFGWVYFYNSKEFVETGNFDSSLVGNAPVIVDDMMASSTEPALRGRLSTTYESFVKEFVMRCKCPIANPFRDALRPNWSTKADACGAACLRR